MSFVEWESVRNFLEEGIPEVLKPSRNDFKKMCRSHKPYLPDHVFTDFRPQNKSGRLPKTNHKDSRFNQENKPFDMASGMTKHPTLIAGRKVSRPNLLQVPAIPARRSGINVVNNISKGAYTMSGDKKGVTIDALPELRRRVRGEPYSSFTFDEHDVSQEKVVVNYSGDGYRHCRNQSVVQIGVNVSHRDRPLVGELSSSIKSLSTVAVWAGGESRAELEEKAEGAFKLSASIHEAGGLVVSWATEDSEVDKEDGRDRDKTVLCEEVCTGDASYQMKAGAQCSMNNCLYCEQHKTCFHEAKQGFVRFNTRQAYLAHRFPTKAHEGHGVWVCAEPDLVSCDNCDIEIGESCDWFTCSECQEDFCQACYDNDDFCQQDHWAYIHKQTSDQHDQAGCAEFHGHSGLLQERDQPVPSEFDSDVLYDVKFDSHPNSRGKAAKVPGHMLRKGFRCPVAECPFEGDPSSSMPTIQKSMESSHRKTHGGVSCGVLSLWENVERWMWLCDVLHLLLNNTVQLYSELVAKVVKGKKKKEKQILLFLKEMNISTATKDSVQKTMFVGKEAESWLENGYRCYDYVYGKDETKRKAAYVVHVMMLDYMNVLYMRFAPSLELELNLRARGRKTIDAWSAAASPEKVRSYWHQLVCAVPMQSRYFQLMHFSGQAIENLNRYSKGINDNGKMNNAEVSMVEQNAKQRIALTKLDVDGAVKRTVRQRQRDRGQVGTKLLVFGGTRFFCLKNLFFFFLFIFHRSCNHTSTSTHTHTHTHTHAHIHCQVLDLPNVGLRLPAK